MGIFNKRPVQVKLDMNKPVPEVIPQTPMVSLRKEASVSLRKHGVDGKGVKVYLVVDYSGSMRPWYGNGAVQRIADQALALGAELDDDGTVEAWYYDTNVSEKLEISLDTSSPDSYVGWVQRTSNRGHMGLTNTAAAIRTVSRYHAKHGGGLPGLVVFQTDGSPYTGGSQARDRRDAETALIQASHDPETENLFFAFVGFGTRATVDFLFTLDKLAGRKHDNASAMAVEDFRRITDSQLFDGVLGEFTTEFLPEILGQS
jgi:TerF-like vWA domain-containing protein